MRYGLRRPLGLAAAAIASLTAFALPVASASASTAALAQFTFTKTGGVNRQVTLECNPTGGTHPTPDDACSKLTAVNGNFALLPPVTGVFCTAYYDPVTVTVSGYWQLQPVSYTKTYTNDCVAGVASDYVFRF